MPYGDIDLVNIDSAYDSLPDATKPLPEMMLTYYQIRSVRLVQCVTNAVTSFLH